MNYYDITPIISNNLGVFPGDTRFSRKISMDFKSGHHLLLSEIQSTLHLGAHADSTGHYHQDGVGIDQKELKAYCGPCQVVEVSAAKGRRVLLSDFDQKLIRQKRILFKTNSFPDPDSWNSDFCGLSPEVIEFLSLKGVILVGLDTPSVDPEDSKELETHQAIYRSQMSILEGLVLKRVPQGQYTLIALPLPIKDADASPVRAILLEDWQLFPTELVKK